MMSDKCIADYFIVAGLPDDKTTTLKPNLYLAQKAADCKDPIVDIVVINRSLGESPPELYECIEKTVSGQSANLNAGSFRSREIFLCFRRGRHKPPLTDIG